MQTIEDVLNRLEEIIQWAKEQQSPMGYFPVVYYHMTKSVERGIAEGLFEDGARMEKLDVVFARRYVEAFDNWQEGKPTTGSWAIAFEAAEQKKLTVLQHILLGINAHIHLDLGIAAAQIQPGDSIQLLKTDFEQINTVIESLVDPVQDRLSEVFPLFGLIDWILRKRDERFANQIISLGRLGAWKVATTLAALDPGQQPEAIRQLDKGVEAVGSGIIKPGRWLSAALQTARFFELGTVEQKIEKLRDLRQ